MSDNQRLTQLYAESLQSEDAALLQYAKTLDSIESKMNQLSTSFQQFYMSVLNGPVIGGALNFFKALLELLNKIPKVFSVPTVILGMKTLGAVLTTMVAKYKAAANLIDGSNISIWNTLKQVIFGLNSTKKAGAQAAIGFHTADTAMKATTISAHGLRAALGWVGIALTAITVAVGIWNAIKPDTTKLTQMAEDSRIALAETKKEYNDLIKAEKELSEAETHKDESLEARQKWLDLNHELIDTYPQLLSHYDAEGNAIADLGDSYRYLTEQAKEAYLEQAKTSMGDTLRANIAAFNDLSKGWVNFQDNVEDLDKAYAFAKGLNDLIQDPKYKGKTARDEDFQTDLVKLYATMYEEDFRNAVGYVLGYNQERIDELGIHSDDLITKFIAQAPNSLIETFFTGESVANILFRKSFDELGEQIVSPVIKAHQEGKRLLKEMEGSIEVYGKGLLKSLLESSKNLPEIFQDNIDYVATMLSKTSYGALEDAYREQKELPSDAVVDQKKLYEFLDADRSLWATIITEQQQNFVEEILNIQSEEVQKQLVKPLREFSLDEITELKDKFETDHPLYPFLEQMEEDANKILEGLQLKTTAKIPSSYLATNLNTIPLDIAEGLLKHALTIASITYEDATGTDVKADVLKAYDVLIGPKEGQDPEKARQVQDLISQADDLSSWYGAKEFLSSLSRMNDVAEDVATVTRTKAEEFASGVPKTIGDMSAIGEKYASGLDEIGKLWGKDGVFDVENILTLIDRGLFNIEDFDEATGKYVGDFQSFMSLYLDWVEEAFAEIKFDTLDDDTAKYYKQIDGLLKIKKEQLLRDATNAANKVIVDTFSQAQTAAKDFIALETKVAKGEATSLDYQSFIDKLSLGKPLEDYKKSGMYTIESVKDAISDAIEAGTIDAVAFSQEIATATRQENIKREKETRDTQSKLIKFTKELFTYDFNDLTEAQIADLVEITGKTAKELGITYNQITQKYRINFSSLQKRLEQVGIEISHTVFSALNSLYNELQALEKTAKIDDLLIKAVTTGLTTKEFEEWATLTENRYLTYAETTIDGLVIFNEKAIKTFTLAQENSLKAVLQKSRGALISTISGGKGATIKQSDIDATKLTDFFDRMVEEGHVIQGHNEKIIRAPGAVLLALQAKLFENISDVGDEELTQLLDAINAIVILPFERAEAAIDVIDRMAKNVDPLTDHEAAALVTSLGFSPEQYAALSAHYRGFTNLIFEEMVSILNAAVEAQLIDKGHFERQIKNWKRQNEKIFYQGLIETGRVVDENYYKQFGETLKAAGIAITEEFDSYRFTDPVKDYLDYVENLLILNFGRDHGIVQDFLRQKREISLGMIEGELGRLVAQMPSSAVYGEIVQGLNDVGVSAGDAALMIQDLGFEIGDFYRTAEGNFLLKDGVKWQNLTEGILKVQEKIRNTQEDINGLIVDSIDNNIVNLKAIELQNAALEKQKALLKALLMLSLKDKENRYSFMFGEGKEDVKLSGGLTSYLGFIKEAQELADFSKEFYKEGVVSPEVMAQMVTNDASAKALITAFDLTQYGVNAEHLVADRARLYQMAYDLFFDASTFDFQFAKGDRKTLIEALFAEFNKVRQQGEKDQQTVDKMMVEFEGFELNMDSAEIVDMDGDPVTFDSVAAKLEKDLGLKRQFLEDIQQVLQISIDAQGNYVYSDGTGTYTSKNLADVIKMAMEKGYIDADLAANLGIKIKTKDELLNEYRKLVQQAQGLGYDIQLTGKEKLFNYEELKTAVANLTQGIDEAIKKRQDEKEAKENASLEGLILAGGGLTTAGETLQTAGVVLQEAANVLKETYIKAEARKEQEKQLAQKRGEVVKEYKDSYIQGQNLGVVPEDSMWDQVFLQFADLNEIKAETNKITQDIARELVNQDVENIRAAKAEAEAIAAIAAEAEAKAEQAFANRKKDAAEQLINLGMEEKEVDLLLEQANTVAELEFFAVRAAIAHREQVELAEQEVTYRQQSLDIFQQMGETLFNQQTAFSQLADYFGITTNELQLIFNTIGDADLSVFQDALKNIEEIKQAAANVPLEVNADTSGAKKEVNELISFITGKAPIIKVKIRSSESTAAAGTPPGGSKGGKTLVGELGPELRISNGQYSLVGQQGAEFVNLKRGDIILNHLQTQKALGQAAKTTGPALAIGTGNLYSFDTSAILQSIYQSGGGGTKPSSRDVKNAKDYNFELEKWFNWLRQIERLEREITYLQAKRENYQFAKNLTLGGERYAASLLVENQLLEAQNTVLEDLIRQQRLDLAERARELDMHYLYGQYITFQNGVMQVNEEGLRGLVGQNQELGDAIKKAIDEYLQWENALATNKTTIEENMRQIEENLRIMVDMRIRVENELLQSLKNMYQKEIDAKRKTIDEKKKLDDQYLNGLRKNLQKEKEAREKNTKAEDKAQLRRKLALLERDTSGRNAQEIMELRNQLSLLEEEEYFSLREEAITNVEEGIQLAQDAMQAEVDALIAANALKLENMQLYWSEVNSIMEEGVESILSFLASYNQSYLDQSATAQQRYLQEWEFTTAAALSTAESVAEQIAALLERTQSGQYTTPEGNPSDPAPSGSGGGGGGTTKPKERWKAEYKVTHVEGSNTGYGVGDTKTQAEGAAAFVAKKKYGDRRGYSFSITKTYKYRKGGIADYTGLAMLHGSPQDPEAVLNPLQTKIYMGIAAALERMIKAPFTPQSQAAENNNIVVNIDIKSGVVTTKTQANNLSDSIFERLAALADKSGSISVFRR